MRLNEVPLLERTDDKLRYTGYYEWYCRKDKMIPGREPVFTFRAAHGEAISDKEYYDYLKFVNVKREEMLSREECYQLVRDLYCNNINEEEQIKGIDILDAKVIQCSLF